MRKTKLVCKHCGSEDIHYLAWVDVKTHKFMGESSWQENEEDTYCNTCEGNRGICTEKEYVKLKKES